MKFDKMIKQLYEKEVIDVAQHDDEQGDRRMLQMFFSAIEQGNVNQVKNLIEDGVDVNARDGSAIYKAVYRDRLDIVKLLIDGGADVNLVVPGIRGAPLALAAANGQLEMVKLLIASGADVHANRESALSNAFHFPRLTSAPIIRELLKAGADFKKI